MENYLIEMCNISKSFPGVRALHNVNLEISKGEIVCLLGENGAGKSTLMKVLTGVYKQDSGMILFNGKELDLTNTRQAYQRGINIIFQEFNLCPNLSAMENIFLGNENRTKYGLFSHKRTRQKALDLFKKLDIVINTDVPVATLSVAQQQMVEIAKTLSYETKLLIMDEPTSALTMKEIETLFTIIRSLKKQGVAVIFISHKLEEVLAISDRIVVLRDGENCGNILAKDATENTLVSLMVGRAMTDFYTKRNCQPSEEILLEARGITGGTKIKDVSFSIRKGEELGLAGLVGAGRNALVKLLIGADPKSGGSVFMHGQEIRIQSPKDAIKHRIAYLPEDRKFAGLVLPMTTRENATLCVHTKIQNMIGVINRKKENAIADTYIDDLRIKVFSREQVAETLSGGNQQKIVLAKALAVEPLLLILCEPTRGIDVGAKAEVHSIIAELADSGISILIISSELQEILNLADRVLVMHEGVITANFPIADANQENVMRAAIGSA
ncbi:MAG: sugar ABC transporter ATP-binding protein [Sphaerochaetaceae bacterium]|nr:sugar ABC transporter ATP-binding protein [Sphaerochaetaceae bacterium]